MMEPEPKKKVKKKKNSKTACSECQFSLIGALFRNEGREKRKREGGGTKEEKQWRKFLESEMLVSILWQGFSWLIGLGEANVNRGLVNTLKQLHVCCCENFHYHIQAISIAISFEFYFCKLITFFLLYSMNVTLKENSKYIRNRPSLINHFIYELAS